MRFIGKLIILGILLIGIWVIPFPYGTINQERVFNLQASQYEFAPDVIQVQPGDQVTINLISKDVVHGLYIDQYDLNMQADPGQTASLQFIADRKGGFNLRCSVACGAMHPFMLGKLQVGVNETLYRSILSLPLLLLGVLWKNNPVGTTI
ncbi:MAG TPA: cupredoxin domain-containing protein [Prolixibacteraceae bacterium]|nr:cupredoxin domain-containing protein [Prolixibacteraceae bacterium]